MCLMGGTIRQRQLASRGLILLRCPDIRASKYPDIYICESVRKRLRDAIRGVLRLAPTSMSGHY